MCAESFSQVQLCVVPWTVAQQAPLSMQSLQARILEWVALSSSRGSSQPRDRTQVSHIAGRFFTSWATKETHLQIARQDESQAAIKIARKNINSLRFADDTTLMAESEEELKSLLLRMKGEREKAGLKVNIQKKKRKKETKIMVYSPITSWQTDGKTIETVTLYFLGLQNHCSYCSHEIKRCLLLGKKAMTNLDSIFKSRDITLLTKVHIVKAMVLPVVIYEPVSWTVKNAEHRRIDAFKLQCWKRLLSVPWTARRSNQSILKEINLNIHLKDWCWSWSSNTLAIWYKEQTRWKRPWCWEKLKANGKGAAEDELVR